jgi:hypothetical protein
MNTPNDIRWLLFATVPVHGYINVATPISRGIIWLCRRAAGSVQSSFRRVQERQRTWEPTRHGADTMTTSGSSRPIRK